VLAPADQALPFDHLGPQPEALVLVVYSANLGAIISGYQVSSLATTSIPQVRDGCGDPRSEA
jgi:hypothetical protein